LSENVGLTYLNLRSNNVTCEGAQQLLEFARSDWARERSQLGFIDLQGSSRVLVDAEKGGKKDALEIAATIRDQLCENRRVASWKLRCPFFLFVLRQLLNKEECRELFVPTEIVYYILVMTGLEIKELALCEKKS
jgi:hypothetical protein